jgi:hypothetical protein
LSNRKQLLGHESNQYKADKELSLDTNLSSIQANISLSPDLENYEMQIAQGRGNIIETYRGSIGDEATKLKIQKFNDDTISKTISTLLDGTNYQQAKTLLDSQKDSVSKKVYNDLNEMINKGKYIEIAKDISNSGLDYEKQLKEVDKIKDPVLLAQVRKEVLWRQKQEQTFDKLEQKEYENNQWELMFTDPFGYNLEQQIDKVDPKTYKALEDYKKEKLKELNGEGSEIGWEAYDRYMRMDINRLDNEPVNQIVSSVKNTSKITDVLKRRAKGDNDKTFRTRTYLKQGTDLMNTSKALGGKRPTAKLKIKHKEKRNAFMEEFTEKIALMPEKDRTEEKIGEMGRELIFQQTASDRKKRNRAIKNPPPTLTKVPNLNYDVDEEVYYVDYGKKRRLYDQDGNFIVEGNIPR